MRVSHHKLAREELMAAAVYYQQQEEGLACFRDAYKAAVAEVEANPKAYRILIDDMHRFLVDRFPYALIYRVRQDEIQIVAVPHLKWKPFYWAERA
jgi:plasmid stabilization system protein ParE